MSSPKQQSVDLSSLSIQNLSAVKQQLDNELEHLTTSFAKLRAAQTKFRECIKSVRAGVNPMLKDKTILVPLTSSLYVPGALANTENVIVDVGTGYYFEKSAEDAETFYSNKAEMLQANLVDLEKVITQKTQNVRVVEDVLRQKVLSSQSGATATAT